MPGGSGPTVTLQTPLSSLVISLFPGPPTAWISPLLTLTFSALGAVRRKVTLPSGWTSGETRGAARRGAWARPGCGQRPTRAAASTAAHPFLRFMTGSFGGEEVEPGALSIVETQPWDGGSGFPL